MEKLLHNMLPLRLKLWNKKTSSYSPQQSHLLMKKALLVTVELTTRVVVDVDATDEQIAKAAGRNYIRRIENDEVLENIAEHGIKDDVEMPYGSLSDEIEK